jgi:hypothetical protein
MFDAEKIRTQIERSAVDEMELSPEQALEVAFHMTDWLDDLQRYVKFCENPGSFGPEEVDELLLAFLVHVPNHVAAAAKLYADMPVSDVFKVGAIVPNENWRDLSRREADVLAHLFRADFLGRDELVAQASTAQACRVDTEGSLRFLVDGPLAEVVGRVPVEGFYHDGEAEPGRLRPAVHLLVHVIDGRLHELEVYKDDGADIIVSPFDVAWSQITVTAR